MLDLLTESTLSLSQAACELPKLGGRKLHASSLWRWARKGVRGVKLEYVRLGGRILTSREALARFAQRLAEADEREDAGAPIEGEPTEYRQPVTKGRTPQQRAKAIECARAELNYAGL